MACGIANKCANDCMSGITHPMLLLMFTARRYASAVFMLSSCARPFVCLSVTSRHCTKTTKCRITQTTLHDSAEASFLTPKILAKFHRGHPKRWHQIQLRWVAILAIFNQYLTISQKRCKIGHSYYGKLIGTRISSIEWRYFQ